MCVRKGSVSYGLVAEISLPHCLPGGRYLEAAEDQPRHESDTKVEIPCLIVRYDALSRGTHATGSPFFSCANISSAYA